MGDARLMTFLERLAILVASLALSIGLIALLSGFFTARDVAGISGSTGPGEAFRDLGHAHLRPGQPHGTYDSSPPTSGPHRPRSIRRDEARLSNDQLLQALELGDVVVMYGGPNPPPGLKQLTHTVGAAFTRPLAAVGQAMILARRPGTVGLIGLAWAHMVRVSAPNDPLLRDFAQFWLGKGAPRR